MKLTQYFLSQGKLNASNSKALKLIEKVCPNLNDNKNLRPSMFINNIFDEIENKFKQNQI